MKPTDFPKEILEKRAIIYVRQSTATQVHENLESQRRQYELAELARSLGFHDVVTIDDDLGKSASGEVVRPGFDSMVSQVCQGVVGAIFAIEVSRLARNGREWHHLIELCGLVGARVVDLDGTYDPGSANDRLLLGLKGEISAFELHTIQRRMLDAIFSKARRGELQMTVPVGYGWTPEGRLELNPDARVQEAIRTVFRLFDELRSIRRVMLRMQADEVMFPRPAGKRSNSPLVWSPVIYSSVKCVLTNPIFSGAYAWGRRGSRTQIVNGRAHKSRGHPKPRDKWILIRDHHAAYISWERFEANQEQIRNNSYAAPSAASKSARGGCGLLSGLLRCRRCGRMLGVSYNGKQGLARYYCRTAHSNYGLAPCPSLPTIVRQRPPRSSV